MKKLRIAVVGAGHLGRIHARLLKSLDDVELVGVVDNNEACGRKAARQLATQFASNHRKWIGQIDAAVVAVPSIHHHAVGIDLLSAGIHLLVEKPLATTLDHADELIAAARRRGAVLQVGHVERFNPALTAVESLPGRPRYIEAVRSGGYTGRSTDIGAVLDLMIHDIDVVLSLVRREVTEVHASGAKVLGPHEDLAEARLTFADGCVANLRASRVSRNAERKMEIYTEQAYARVDFATPAASIVSPCKQLLRGEIEIDDLPADERQQIIDNLFDQWLPQRDLEIERGNAILEEQHDFVTSIRSSSMPRVTGEQARDALAVAERVLAAIESRSPAAFGHSQAATIPLPTERDFSAAPVRKAG